MVSMTQQMKKGMDLLQTLQMNKKRQSFYIVLEHGDS